MKRWEIYIYALLVAALNLPLAVGAVSESMIFSMPDVLNGQLWRIFTHPFVHVSWYHLLLDATAFFVLYIQLDERSRTKRTLYVVGCGISSLLAAIVASTRIDSIGYCGLSGIGHGLMAVCALEMIKSGSQNKSVKLSGIICLGMLIGKCLIEAFTGKMILSPFHTDLIGSPVALAHTGGLLGGCAMYVIFHAKTEAIIHKLLYSWKACKKGLECSETTFQPQ